MSTTIGSRPVNVDNVTLQNVGGQVSVKDGGVDTTQLADGAVPTIKLDTEAVTSTKQNLLHLISETDDIQWKKDVDDAVVFEDFDASGFWAEHKDYISLYNAVASHEGFKSLKTFQKEASKIITLIFDIYKQNEGENSQKYGLFDATDSYAMFDLYTTSSNYIRFHTAAGGVITTTALDVLISGITDDYHTLKMTIENASAKGYIDDVLKATHTTNLPTVVMDVVCKGYGGADIVNTFLKNISCVKEAV